MSKSLRLLQIEDSESDADMILRLLMQAGFEVSSHRVEDAAGLRHALEDPSWDVIIADYHLPGFDAPGALRILQECGRDIPCIVVSGMMGEDTAVEMMKSGAHDYMTKNNLARLAPAVERELAEAVRRRETRQAQQQLRESEERLALAVDATQIGTFDYYPQTGKLIWSKFARQHYGVSPEAEVNYDTFMRTLHPADRDRVLQTVQDALHHENGGEYAHEYRTVGIEDGEERWLSSRGRVFFDEESRAIRIVGVIQNVTERKRLERQLLQSQKLESVGRLAASIAHDFNNLLTVINGYAHLVLAGMNAADALRESMEELSKAAMQASALTRQLVSFSRRQVAEPKTIVANELVKDFENMLSRLLGENIELELSLDPQAGAFRADPGQMGQVLMNLAVNAKDAMPSGGKLLIETSKLVVNRQLSRANLNVSHGEYVVLTVTDTGTGMTAEVQSHLFEPFYTTKEQGKGTGLGLSTVYGIVVNQSRGSISVSSEPDRGSTFSLFFPSSGFENAADMEVSIGQTSVRGETILLAEDEPGVRKYTRKILERSGYTILEATNGVEALAVARSHPGTIHLLLTDIIMPMMGGVELTERFNAEFPGIPVLFMTAYTDQIMRHWNVLSAYIQKPYNLSDLLTQVRELLGSDIIGFLACPGSPRGGLTIGLCTAGVPRPSPLVPGHLCQVETWAGRPCHITPPLNRSICKLTIRKLGWKLAVVLHPQCGYNRAQPAGFRLSRCPRQLFPRVMQMKSANGVSRREFLAGCSATIGSAALASAAGQAVADTGNVRFGVRTPLPEKLSLRERGQLVKRLGYDGIELGAEWLNQPVEAIQEQLAGIGIAVSAIVGSIKLLDTDPLVRAKGVELDRQRLEMARALGANDIIEVPVFGPNKFQDLSPIMTAREVEERLVVAELKELAPNVQQTGINLMIEPCNQKETHFMYLQSQAAKLIEAVDAPGFRLLSDFYHMQLEERDIAATLKEYGKHTVYVHLADGKARTAPGSLPFDYRPGFRALKNWGFSGWLNMEFRATENHEAVLASALAYIKKQWAEA